MSIPTPSPPLLIPGGLALSEREKAETLAESLETISAGERSFGTGSH